MLSENQKEIMHHQGIEMLQQARRLEIRLASPIDISVESTQHLQTEPVEWKNVHSFPVKLILLNSGNIVMVKGHWKSEIPRLTGGHLDGEYTFSQIHFHWRTTTNEMMHTIKGESHPLEMHVVFFKSCYKNETLARQHDDGTVIVVYFFKEDKRSSISWLTNMLAKVTIPKAVAELPSFPLSALLVPFTGDYLMYWGALPCSTLHPVQWVIARSPLRITTNEINDFDQIQTHSKRSESSNKFKPDYNKRTMFHVNPSHSQHSILHEVLDPPSLISIFPKKIEITVVSPPAATVNTGNQSTTITKTESRSRSLINKCMSRNFCQPDKTFSQHFNILDTQTKSEKKEINVCENVSRIQHREQPIENKMKETQITTSDKYINNNNSPPSENFSERDFLSRFSNEKQVYDMKMFTFDQQQLQPILSNMKSTFNINVQNKFKREKSRLTMTRKSLYCQKRTRYISKKISDKEKTQKESIKSLLAMASKENKEKGGAGFMVIETAEIQKWLENIKIGKREEAEENPYSELSISKPVNTDDSEMKICRSHWESSKRNKNEDQDIQKLSLDFVFTDGNPKLIPHSSFTNRQDLLNDERKLVSQNNEVNTPLDSVSKPEKVLDSPMTKTEENEYNVIDKKSGESLLENNPKETSPSRKVQKPSSKGIQRKTIANDEKSTKNKTVSPVDYVSNTKDKANTASGKCIENNKDRKRNEKELEKGKETEKLNSSKIPVREIPRKRYNPKEGVQSSLVHLFRNPGTPPNKKISCEGSPTRPSTRKSSQISVAHVANSPWSSLEKKKVNNSQVIRQSSLMTNKNSLKTSLQSRDTFITRKSMMPCLRLNLARLNKSSVTAKDSPKSNKSEAENICMSYPPTSRITKRTMTPNKDNVKTKDMQQSDTESICLSYPNTPRIAKKTTPIKSNVKANDPQQNDTDSVSVKPFSPRITKNISTPTSIKGNVRKQTSRIHDDSGENKCADFKDITAVQKHYVTNKPEHDHENGTGDISDLCVDTELGE